MSAPSVLSAPAKAWVSGAHPNEGHSVPFYRMLVIGSSPMPLGRFITDGVVVVGVSAMGRD
eukprot:6024022-Alexandrium_andersonii.AAC.1